MEQVILMILATGFVAVILGVILKRFDVPPIVGYILSGIILINVIGTHGENSHTLEQIADFGIVFLMFTIGLEMKLENLMQMRKQVFIYGGLQVGLSTLLFTFLTYYIFGLDIKASVVIGAALSLSSTAIVLKILNDTNNISNYYGQNSLGVLIFQDLSVVPILIVLTIFSSKDSSIGALFLDILYSGILLLIVTLIFGRYLLDPILKLVNKADTHELFIMIVLIIAIGSSFLAYYLGFTYSMGAFIGGMLIAETHYKHQVEADLIPFRELLLGLFFVSVGLQLDFKIIAENILIIFLILPIFMIIKGLIVISILYGQRTHNKLKSCLLLCGLGEFGLVILDLGQSKGLILTDTSQILSATIIISLLITPLLINKINLITNLFLIFLILLSLLLLYYL